jgi:hypothetical protein
VKMLQLHRGIRGKGRGSTNKTCDSMSLGADAPLLCTTLLLNI